MMKSVNLAPMALIGVVLWFCPTFAPSHVFAADKDTQAKPPKSASQVKASKPKQDKPKFQSAETASKAEACFGVAPKIEQLTPDEGKAGESVTIKGTRFGPANCLRGVSFGPGRPAKFTFKNDTTVTAAIPSGGRKGLAILTVTTASGEDSKAFLMK
ncbi:MAG: hypothetical protein P0111_06985 [Nitrospira sp.]|nr:hypothetical protein [Nitrospira sp.]